MKPAIAVNRVGNFRTFATSREMNPAPTSTDGTILRLIGRNQRVLELGCASGNMSGALRDQGCTVVGIEIHREAAQSAAQICERVIVGDLDYMSLENELGAERFDVVLAADVLEHLKDPLSVLQSIKAFLHPHGRVVISVPNIAHISVRLALLSGRFPYGPSGLLDQTHLRFLTRESLEEMLEEADLAIGHFERITNVPPDPSSFEVPYDPSIVPAEVLEQMLRDPDAMTYQFVLSCYPLPQSGLGFIQNRIKELAKEAATLRLDGARVQVELDGVQKLSETSRLDLAAARQEVTVLREKLTVAEMSSAALLVEKVAAEQRITLLETERASLNEEVTQLHEIATATQQEWSTRFQVLSAEGQSLEAERDSLAAQVTDLQETLRLSEQEYSRRIAALSLERASVEQDVLALQDKNKALHMEIGRTQTVSSESQGACEALESAAKERNAQIEEQNLRIKGLKAQVETLFAREKDLRDMLLEAHDELLRRDEDIILTLGSSLAQPSAPSPTGSGNSGAPQPGAAAGGKYLQYQQMVHTIRDVVRTRLPEGSKVLVISKGDDDLLQLEPCHGLHFPQRDDGRYAGYYPVNGAAALDHLNELRNKGSQFLLVPQTAFWWLDHYREFADYLKQNCTRVIDDAICVVFGLANANANAKATSETPAVHVHRYAPQSRPFGVNVAGNLTSEKGVGEAVRSQVRSLISAGIPVALNNVLEDTALNSVNEFREFSDDNPYAINLIHLNADALSDFVECRERSYFEGRVNIGFWAWETSAFPREWWNRFQHLDEVWVGSDFVLDAVSRVSPIPVIKTPLAVLDHSSYKPLPRSSFGLSDKTFILLFAFDYMSIAERKNPMGVVQAFRKAFSGRDDVMLVLKCGHCEAYPREAAMLRAACKGANIRILDKVSSRHEVSSLMSAADCYVSLHRSEGFGLTMAEAMSLGKPVIATGYSGNMEYMTAANSYLVKYELIPIATPHGPYHTGEWADPDLDHAASLMRFVFENPGAAKEVGNRARADIRRTTSPRAAGTTMRNRILRLAELGKIPAPDTQFVEVDGAGDKEYRLLVTRIRETVERHLPEDSRVVVVSKGDDDLLFFTGRAGWHFPQENDGTYAGYYPRDGAEAIERLESLRKQGGEYFLLPRTGFWWLDHYSQLKSHLESRYRRVWSDHDCMIFGLREKSNGMVSRFREKIALWTLS
jgi:2-polyprenyl-3-methyl-5-hydroxy-6-metoxy-1,4-benzoquinol methylase/glycosyltransferase involved in cell wall biosynthesis